MIPPVAAAAGAWKAMPPRSHGRADASLPTLSGLYWRGMRASAAGAEPAPWKAKGDAFTGAPADLRARMTMPTTTMTTSASRAISRNWPNSAPRPSELASQARPRPAARPPSMAPQGFLGAAAAVLGAAAGLAAVVPAAFCVGAAGAAGGVAASRWVTLLDCLPMDLPPPRRRASASRCTTANMATKTTDHSFIMASPKYR